MTKHICADQTLSQRYYNFAENCVVCLKINVAKYRWCNVVVMCKKWCGLVTNTHCEITWVQRCSDVFTWVRNSIINNYPNINLETSRLIEELVVIIDRNLPPEAFMNHDQLHVPPKRCSNVTA